MQECKPEFPESQIADQFQNPACEVRSENGKGS